MLAARPHQHSIVLSPLVHLAAAMSAGIVLSEIDSVKVGPVVLLAALLAIAALILLLKNCLLPATLVVIGAALFLGAALALIAKDSLPRDSLKKLLVDRVLELGTPVEITGVVAGPPEYAPDYIYLDLRLEMITFKDENKNTSGLVALSVPLNRETAVNCELLELRYGARVRVMTTLERTSKFRNPGVTDFTEYLDRHGYDATALVKSPLLIERLDDEPVLLPLAWLFEWRRIIQQAIKSKFSLETSGVLAAALLGNRHGLSHSSAERFREGGTFHVLVISGLHISFIGALVLFITRRLTSKRKLQFVCSAIILWSYTLAVGAETSVVRAAFMFTFVTFAPLVSRRAVSLNALGAAAVVLLCWRPENLFDPSFQLTFLSVAAIVALAWPALERMSTIGSWKPTRAAPYPPIAPSWLRELSELLFWSERRWREDLQQSTHSYRLFKSPMAAKLERYHLQGTLRYTFAAVVVSVSVQLTLLPLLIVYFHRVSTASIILNIAVSLLLAAVSFVALVVLLVALISETLAAPLIALANGTNWLMLHTVDPFAAAGVASLRLPEYSGWASVVYVLYYAPLVLIAHSVAKWDPLAPLPGLRTKQIFSLSVLLQSLATGLILLHPFSAISSEGKLRVDFLDVGQGDAALISMPNGATLMVDGGGRPDFRRQVSGDDLEQEFQRDSRSIGEAVVSEVLWYRGLDSIDYVLASHADADHIDGLNDILRNFRVRGAFAGRTPANDPQFAKFAALADERRVPVVILGAGDVLRFGDVTAEVLWPNLNSSVEARSGNNESVVLRLQFGARSFLLTGDVEAPAEAGLMRSGVNLQADVAKVAHHGSRTSSTEEVIRAVGARWAIISVGQFSMFGHPHEEVVERWRTNQATVLTTGNSGTITVITDGEKLQIETFVRNVK